MAFTWAWTFGQSSCVHWVSCLNSCGQIRRAYRRVLSRDMRFPQRYWWRFNPYGMWLCRCRHYDPSKLQELLAQRHSVTVQKTCVFMTVVWLYPTCSSDLLHVSRDITRVTSVSEEKIWNISSNIWRNKRMRHFIFFYSVTPVVGFDLQKQFCVCRKLPLFSVNSTRQYKINSC